MEKIDISKAYLSNSAKVSTMFGYALNGAILGAIVDDIDAPTLAFLCDKTIDSKGIKECLKFRLNKSRVEWFSTHAHIITICQVSDFDALKDEMRANGINRLTRGDMFEYALVKYENATQNANPNKCYKEGGDLLINGIDYQCKFENATIVPR